MSEPEKIVSIEEVTNYRHKAGTTTWYVYMDGYKVITDKRTILLLISNHQSCCESFGYFFTNDNPKDFIGAKFLDIKIVDQCLNKEKAPEVYDGECMFVDMDITATPP